VGVRFKNNTDFLSLKVNVSIPEHHLKQKRAENFFVFLKTHLPCLSQKISINEIENDLRNQNELLSKDLEVKLKTYLKNKCYGYY
jgi:hypothetical protein